jgi:SAM-dependent methyltransferase
LRFHAVRDYITDERFDVHLCRGCGLGITAPMPDDSQIGRYYSASYRGDRHAFTDGFRIAMRSRALAKQFPNNFLGRMLDIGCGDGAFAMHQKGLGWDVAVTEIHGPTLERLRGQGIEAHAPRDAFAGAIDGMFDAVTCWHVLEHAIRPDALARWVRRLLAPHGVFHVSVPNLASWQARAYGKHWLHLDVPRHRYHFDDRTLRRLLHDAGFIPVEWSSVVLEYDWFGAIQSPLNAMCVRPNVLFEQMTSRAPVGRDRASRTDRSISYLFAAPLAAASLPVCVVSEFFGAGATLDVTCRISTSPPPPLAEVEVG